MKKILTAMLLVVSTLAMSQTYPNKPIKIVVPFGPGGPTDQVARIIANRLETNLNVPVVVENKAGASAAIGIDHVAKSPADGYTILLSSNSLISNQYFLDNLPFNASKDFTHVAMISRIPQALIVSSKHNFKSAKDLIEYAKNNPGKLSYGSNGVGTATYIDAESFAHMAGIKLLHVPYKSQPAIINDIMNGTIDMAITSLVNAIAISKSDKVSILGVTTRQRFPLAPEYQTIHESGLRNYTTIAWFGLSMREGTPTEIVNKINSEVNKILNDAEMVTRLQSIGGEVAGGSVQSFQEFIQSENRKYLSIKNVLDNTK